MRVGTWGRSNLAGIIFDDEPDFCERLRKVPVEGGQLGCQFAVIQHQEQPCLYMEYTIGEHEPYAFIMGFRGNEQVIEAMVDHRVLVLFPGEPTKDRPVQGLHLMLDSLDIAMLSTNRPRREN